MTGNMEPDKKLLLQQALVNTALRFGIGYTAVQGILLVATHFLQLNPLGPFRLLHLFTLLFFIVVSNRYIRLFEVAAYYPFSAAFRLGMLTTLIGAASSAMLLYLYLAVAGKTVIERHIAQVKQMMEMTKPQLTEMLGKANVKQVEDQLALITPASLAYDDFFWKMIAGLFFAFILAFFFKRTDSSLT